MATAAMRPAGTPTQSRYYLPSRPAGPSPPDTYASVAAANQPLTPTLPITTPTSPFVHTPPSAGVSPTNNYHLASNVRHIRQPRQPMYIPAALRPSEYASRPTDIPTRPRAPDTPPASKDNSFDSGAPALDDAGLPSATATRSLDASLDELLRRGLSRSASDSLDGELDDVTGPPTNAHWKPDESARDCAVCRQTFSWFFRRHHCRRCGDVVCGAHSARAVPLDQNARFHPRGARSKACDPCAAEWRVVQHLRLSRASSIADSATAGSGAGLARDEGSPTPPALPIPRLGGRGGGVPADEVRIGSLARSEGGMIWSTF